MSLRLKKSSLIVGRRTWPSFRPPNPPFVSFKFLLLFVALVTSSFPYAPGNGWQGERSVDDLYGAKFKLRACPTLLVGARDASLFYSKRCTGLGSILGAIGFVTG